MLGRLIEKNNLKNWRVWKGNETVFHFKVTACLECRFGSFPHSEICFLYSYFPLYRIILVIVVTTYIFMPPPADIVFTTATFCNTTQPFSYHFENGHVINNYILKTSLVWLKSHWRFYFYCWHSYFLDSAQFLT